MPDKDEMPGSDHPAVAGASFPLPGQGHFHGECADALTELYTYLDGELTEARRTLIRAHLDDCNPCFEAFDFEAELRIVLSHRCREAVPDALRRRIAEQIAGLDHSE